MLSHRIEQEMIDEQRKKGESVSGGPPTHLLQAQLQRVRDVVECWSICAFACRDPHAHFRLGVMHMHGIQGVINQSKSQAVS